MVRTFRILRQIPEIFEVKAETYEKAVEIIHDGYVQESEGMSDTYELIESFCSTCKNVTCNCEGNKNEETKTV